MKKNFLLIHGSWTGGHDFLPLLPYLEAGGHRVYIAQLTGLGARRHIIEKEITLETHLLDVLELIHEFDLQDITLVGHSYGGKVATGVWDRARDRVVEVFYIDSSAPDPEDPRLGFYPPMPDIAAKAKKQGGLLPVPRLPSEPWHAARVSPMPARPLLDQLQLQNGPLPEDTLKTYVQATQTKNPYLRKQSERLRGKPNWEVIEIEAGHRVMAEKPGELAAILMA